MISRATKKRLGGFAVVTALILAVFIGAATYGEQNRLRRKPADQERILRDLVRKMDIRVPTDEYAADRILVKFRPTVSALSVGAILTAYGSPNFKTVADIGVLKVQIPSGTSIASFLYALRLNPDVEYAEPDYRTRVQVTPDDELFWRQYALNNTGQGSALPDSPDATQGADIKAITAWDMTTGLSDVIIAVLDTGVDLNHPDIKNKLVSAGRDFINDDNDATDDNWHGTHVAGIAGAETNNGQGIAGVAWNSKILPVKILDQDGSGYYSQLIDGIVWAADQNAKVVNMSLGGDFPSNALLEAVQYAHEKGVIVVAAAGNDGTFVSYPAAYDDFCLAVAATDYNDKHTSWSNTGIQVDIAAPGDRILSLVPTWLFGSSAQPYAFASGTSMAAPHVAGFAALIRSLKSWLSVDEVMNVIRYSADDVNSSTLPGKDIEIGYGRINMERALVPYKLTSAN